MEIKNPDIQGLGSFSGFVLSNLQLIMLIYKWLFTSECASKNRLIFYKSESNYWIEDEIVLTSKHIVIFPKFINNNTIIFSSVIKGGKGGLNLYKIIKKDGKWSAPLNLKKFNTKYDDFSLLYINKYEGYISLNRIDNKDHIFKFTIEH